MNQLPPPSDFNRYPTELIPSPKNPVVRRFRIVDALLLTYATAVAIAVCKMVGDGLMTIAGFDRVRFYLRVGISVVATILTMYLAVAPRERRAILFRPGRAVLWATSLTTLLFLAVRLPEIWLYPEIYGDLQWIVAEDFIFSPDSKPVYAVLSVFLFGLLSRTFLWSIDWVELVGYGVLFSWGVLAVLDLLLYYWDLLVV